MTLHYKYPKTQHLSYSSRSSITQKDRQLSNEDHFAGMQVVVSEKLDGEGASLYRNFIHARSLSGRDHFSRHWVKGLHGEIKDAIPEGWRICGENMFAKHSIFYKELPSYFIVFGIYNNKNKCLSVDEMIFWCKSLRLEYVPILYDGLYDEKKIRACFTGQSRFGGLQEGYVVRNMDLFHYDDFQGNVAKYVRPSHVQTSEFWLHQKIIPNQLKINEIEKISEF
tara:strand:+ start:161 stop:832 length:672 start_codon:yes stop_codon:yes gene_type:complete